MTNHFISLAAFEKIASELRCLSCGAPLSTRRQRYCSINCRQELKYYLNRRTGLLVTLNVRYATFYFNDKVVVMNVLPYGTRQIFSFIGHRHNGCKPLEDYRRLSNRLGSAWWAEKRRTHKGYLATRHVLDRAVKIDAPLHTIIPKEHFLPAVKKTDLSTLKLTKSDLGFDGIQKRIKRAYWIQAKSHHPDMGGDIQAFRKLQSAYEKLMEWSRKPRFVSFTGFPDKWLYEGGINRWNQPARFSLTHE